MLTMIRADVLAPSLHDLAEPCRRLADAVRAACRAAVPVAMPLAAPADPLLPLAGPLSVGRLCGLFETEWRVALAGWEQTGRVEITVAARAIACRAACAWAGIALQPGEAEMRAAELAGTSLLSRRRAEIWCRRLVATARAARPMPLAGSALALLARGTDARHGARMLLDLLRTIIAAGAAAAPAALAIGELPARAAALADDDGRADFVAALCQCHPLPCAPGGAAEWLAVSLLRRAVRLLSQDMEYETPLPEAICGQRLVIEAVRAA